MPGVMWTEKYRPKELKELVGQADVAGGIGALLEEAGQMPHLLFSGSAGVGKTTTALCIARQVLGENWRDSTLELNASDERGIGMVREKVKKFSRFAGIAQVPFKLIILDEADEMTADAQTALRRIIEDASAHCRFVIIANTVSKIIDPIQSRCASFRFGAVPKKEAVAHLASIAKKEKVSIGPDGLDALYELAGGDLRHAINSLQAAAGQGKITEASVKSAAGLSRASEVDAAVRLAAGGKFEEARAKMIELVKVHGMSETDFVKHAAGSVFRVGLPDPARALERIAEYDYRLLAGANAEIQLAAMLAELG